MSRREEFDQGHSRESVIPADRIRSIIPTAEVKFQQGGNGVNHRLSVATPGIEHIPGAGRVGGVQHSSMSWNAETGEIKGILVERPKRKGVATAMLHTARELATAHGIASPVHSATQTDEGAAWAKRTP